MIDDVRKSLSVPLPTHKKKIKNEKKGKPANVYLLCTIIIGKKFIHVNNTKETDSCGAAGPRSLPKSPKLLFFFFFVPATSVLYCI